MLTADLALPFVETVIGQLLSRVRLFETPWTVARQTPLFMGFSRQEYWSVLPFPPLGDLPSPGIELESLGPLCLLPWQADSLPTERLGKPAVYSQKAPCSRFEVPAVTVQTEAPHSQPQLSSL